MAFATIPSWSTTAGTNTEIDGISLAENVMVPSSVNNAFREMMSQVAEFTRRGSDLASAATLDLDSIDTMFLDITGTTTVTAVTLTDGHSRRARSTGAFQITASATLVVNGSTSSNYTTTAGDLLFFEGYGASTVRVWSVSGGGSTTASTTEVLTGTNAAKAVTPDALAALWEKGSDVASAGTISLGEGGFFHITGTTTITDIDLATAKDGRGAWLEFDGALTLTHNATTLNLPGGANITTAAGDRCYVVQDSTDNVHVLVYQRASGGSLAGGMTLGTEVAATSGAAIDFTSIPSTVKRITIMFDAVSTNGTSRTIVQIGDSGGIETTNYLGTNANIGGTTTAFSSGYVIDGSGSVTASYVRYGFVTLVHMGSNRWQIGGNIARTDAADLYVIAGQKTLSATLDRVRVTTVGGTDTFDAGAINIYYE